MWKTALTGAEKVIIGAAFTSLTRSKLPFSVFLALKITERSTQGVKSFGITIEGRSFALEKEINS